jgi:transcriptional regulator with XRE-family HTH domain
MTRKTRPDPNVQDPIGETTIGRRLWASYMAKGYTRFAFAKTLGVSYSTVDAWDEGRSTPSLDMLLKAIEVLDVPVAGILYGHDGAPKGSSLAQGLPREGRLALFNELGLSPALRAAFAAHEDSTEGRYQVFTRDYVIQWLAAYEASRANGAPEDEAKAEALKAATTARAVVGAIARGDSSKRSHPKPKPAPAKKPRKR